jgi:hypothetical protein
MFAETANIDYHFPFAGKKSGSLAFPFSVCSKQTEVAIFR